MGIVLQKLRRKKTNLEIIEKIDSDIRTIERYRLNAEQSHKKIVGRFILLSFVLYFLAAWVSYLYFFPKELSKQILHIIPLLSAPILILIIKRILSWYYNRKVSKNQSKLVTLREEKKKLLDKVMETETYKVAKEILEKFGMESRISTEITPMKHTQTPGPSLAPSPALRQRIVVPRPNISSTMVTPLQSYNKPMPTTSVGRPMPMTSRLQSERISGPVLPMPRSILPKERSIFDRMVEYLVGDGPSNRYALICRHCNGHNGMALKEEFDYVTFRCCYCFNLNVAKKQRPIAPKLLMHSESEKHTSSDSEADTDHSPVLSDKELDVSKIPEIEQHLSSDSENDLNNPFCTNTNVPNPLRYSETDNLLDFDKVSQSEVKEQTRVGDGDETTQENEPALMKPDDITSEAVSTPSATDTQPTTEAIAL